MLVVEIGSVETGKLFPLVVGDTELVMAVSANLFVNHLHHLCTEQDWGTAVDEHPAPIAIRKYSA